MRVHDRCTVKQPQICGSLRMPNSGMETKRTAVHPRILGGLSTLSVPNPSAFNEVHVHFALHVCQSDWLDVFDQHTI